MPPTYTPGEASNLTGVPPSTLRRYLSDFPEFFSEGAQKKRGRYFTNGDLGTITAIRDLYAGGKTPRDVRERLSKVINLEAPPRTDIMNLPGVLSKIENFQDRLNRVENAINQGSQDQAAQLAQLREQLEQIQSQVSRTAELDALKARLDELEGERRTPWWRRLFGSDR